MSCARLRKSSESKRERRRRRRSSSYSSSSDSSSNDVAQVFRGARPSLPERISASLRERPGALFQEAMEKMQSYMAERQGSASTKGYASVVQYLTTILLPSCQGQMGLRNERELRTIAIPLNFVMYHKLLTLEYEINILYGRGTPWTI